MYVFIFSKLFLARKYLLQMKMYPVELFAEVHDTGIFAKEEPRWWWCLFNLPNKELTNAVSQFLHTFGTRRNTLLLAMLKYPRLCSMHYW